MRRLFPLLLLVLFVKVSYAQRYEIGLFAGGNNVVGDIDSDYYVDPSSFTVGGLYKWNVNSRFALRGNFYYSLAKGGSDDLKYPYSSRLVSGIDYSKNIGNTEILVEWNFFDYNLRKNNSHTPFAFIGVGGVLYESISKSDSLNVGHIEVNSSIGSTVTIPFGLGYKYAITRNLVLAGELSFRYTFSDNLDDSNYQGKNKPKQGYEYIRIGNLNSNDWFTTLGLTLTYVFGRDPCSCGQ